MEKFIRNMDHATVMSLAEQVSCQQGQIVSKTLAQNDHVSLTLFAFDAGEEISTHESEGDALILVLEGSAEVVISGTKYEVKAGESIVMPSRAPHAVRAPEKLKMFLVVVFD